MEVTAQTDQGSTTHRSAPSAIVAAAPALGCAAPSPRRQTRPGGADVRRGAPLRRPAALATLVPVVATLTRGAVNGAGASDAARLTAAFSGSKVVRS